jgi:23S rRNA (pseudouridine1915-N3)-methyltransferase
VKIKVAWIGKTKSSAIQALTDEYLKRLSHYGQTEGLALRDEAALLKLSAARPAKHFLILFDSRGRQLSSEEFAKFIAEHQDRNPLALLLAIGPANGFSDLARRSAGSILSLGPMTLAHELARIVVLEQTYRAVTILKGHPYHLGH